MDTNTITMITQFVSNIGFPIFVAVWMLFRDAQEKEKMTAALDKLSDAILVLHTKIDQINMVNGGGK